MKTKVLRTGWRVSLAAGAAMAMGLAAAPAVQASTQKGAACEGLREGAGFLKSGQHEVAEVQPLRRIQRIGKAQVYRTVGARVTLHAQEGMNPQYLQRVLNCELPREISEIADDNAPVVKTSVHETTRGLQVVIEAEDASQGRDVEDLVRQAFQQRDTRAVDKNAGETAID